MKLSRQSLIDLRRKLSRGSYQKIRLRLMHKGITFSQQYISNCLNPDYSDYNQIIIEEAIILGEEEAQKLYELNHRIELLNDTI